MWFLTLASLCITVAASPAVVAGKRPAAKLDLSMLTEAQRSIFDRVSASEFCNCQSPLTVAGCLEMRPNCKIASHVAGIIKRGVQANVTADELMAFLSSSVMGPFCAPGKSINVSGAPSEGPPTAPVTLVEFADFRCPHCQKAAPIVHQALDHLSKRYPHKVMFVFVPFPLQNHPLSLNAAQAALAADAQGKFRPMHDALMAHPTGDFETPVLLQLAQKAGLDTKRFAKDLQDGRFLDNVRSLKDLGAQVGIESTPAFFINGRRFEFDPTLMSIEDRVEMELDRELGNCQ